jgi:hypothetical protein
MLYFIDSYFHGKNIDGISSIDIKLPIFIQVDRELRDLRRDEEDWEESFNLGYCLTEEEQEKVWVGMDRVKMYLHHLIAMDGWYSLRDTTDIHMEMVCTIEPYFNLICESTLWVKGVKGYRQGVIDNTLLESVAKNPYLVIKL